MRRSGWLSREELCRHLHGQHDFMYYGDKVEALERALEMLADALRRLALRLDDTELYEDIVYVSQLVQYCRECLPKIKKEGGE